MLFWWSPIGFWGVTTTNVVLLGFIFSLEPTFNLLPSTKACIRIGTCRPSPQCAACSQEIRRHLFSTHLSLNRMKPRALGVFRSHIALLGFGRSDECICLYWGAKHTFGYRSEPPNVFCGARLRHICANDITIDHRRDLACGLSFLEKSILFQFR